MDSSSLMCRRCKTGYYPFSPILCTQITSTTNCDLALDNGLCVRCNVGYALVNSYIDGTPMCILPHAYATSDCATFHYESTTAIDATISDRFDLQGTTPKAKGLFIDNILV